MPKGYDPHDAFYKKAKSQNLRARSAFKLDEIQQRWRLIRTGDAVVDLGAAPGGFLQVLAQIVGPTGRIVGVDREEIRPIGGVVATIHSDVMAPELLPAIRAALGRPDAHVVASDLAPKTTGIRDTDEARSVALARRALELAQALLRPEGHFIAKVFMGDEFEGFCRDVKADFHEVRTLRPEATRSRAREAYVVGFRRRPAAPKPAAPRP